MPFSKWNLVRNAITATSPATGQPPPSWHSLASFPKSITNQASMEIYELIIDQLRDDISSLLACILVCRAWVPRSRHLLLRLMICRPLPLLSHGGHGTVNCAVPYLQGSIIYGTTDGVYHGGKNGSRSRLLSINNVSQIEIFPDTNLFICIAGGVLLSMPLEALNSGRCQDSDINRISKHVLLLSVYRSKVTGECHRVCALKTSSLSSTIKVFDVISDWHRGSTLVIAQNLYTPSETFSVRFLTRMRIVAAVKAGFAVRGGFELLELGSASTQGLLDPDDPHLEFAFKKTRPITVFRVSDVFLVCYEKFALFIDRRGRMAQDYRVLQWKHSPHAFALHEPYILAFCNTLIEVWNIETAEMVQKVQGPYHLLNMPESGERVLTMALLSREVTELDFHNERR
ncbi:CNH domain-containing protein [Mycena pura]|uniref:CNH domain-containing protein n=1 Tax=Mycena pura TaxID=153505 RepID=A0AAD6YHN4_9AGAR|nr:CNH domain-containing protein [Mycena pura]